MAINSRLHYLFTSNFKTGVVSVFDVGKPGKEKLTKNIANYPSNPESRELIWLEGRNEFAIGLAKGNVSFMNAKKGEAICKSHIQFFIF